MKTKKLDNSKVIFNYITRTLAITNIANFKMILNRNIQELKFTFIWSETIAMNYSFNLFNCDIEIQKNDLIIRFDRNYDLDCFIIGNNKLLKELKEKMQIIDFVKF